jgi:arylsulfatase A-like enzyme
MVAACQTTGETSFRTETSALDTAVQQAQECHAAASRKPEYEMLRAHMPLAGMPGKIKEETKNHDILGGLDLMATFASLAGVKLPENDRAGKPIIFDSFDMSPVLFGTGKSARKSWFYFTENELTPGAVRVNNYKAVFNLRG